MCEAAAVLNLHLLLQVLLLQISSSVHVSSCWRMGNFTSTTGGVSSSTCVNYVQDLVSQNCVVIFSKTTCPYCKMAKSVFNELGANFKVVELDQNQDGRRVQEVLFQMTGARTVPRVFVNGRCIGGGSETRRLQEEGKLLPLVQLCASSSSSSSSSCCSSSEGSASGFSSSSK